MRGADVEEGEEGWWNLKPLYVLGLKWIHLLVIISFILYIHRNGGIKGRSFAWTSPVETLVCCCRLQFVKKKKKKKKTEVANTKTNNFCRVKSTSFFGDFWKPDSFCSSVATLGEEMFLLVGESNTKLAYHVAFCVIGSEMNYLLSLTWHGAILNKATFSIRPS